MNKSLESLTLSLRLGEGGPPTHHSTSYAFTKLWNKIVVEFLGRAPRTTPKQYQASGEEKIAHAVFIATEQLFLSYAVRLAGGEVDAKIGRYDLNDAQLRACVRWLEMGRACGSTFCAEMREQERRWRVVEWLHGHDDYIWEAVEGALPGYVKVAAEWRAVG